MNQHRCMRCGKIFTSKRKYSPTHNKNICDKCLKQTSNKGQKVVHSYMKIKDMLK